MCIKYYWKKQSDWGIRVFSDATSDLITMTTWFGGFVTVHFRATESTVSILFLECNPQECFVQPYMKETGDHLRFSHFDIRAEKFACIAYQRQDVAPVSYTPIIGLCRRQSYKLKFIKLSKTKYIHQSAFFFSRLIKRLKKVWLYKQFFVFVADI